MKIRIEVDTQLEEEEIIIRCSELNAHIQTIESLIANIENTKEQLVFYKDDTTYYIALNDILFFESESSSVYAHTLSDVYQVKHKLYTLETCLPRHFMRVSKSTILNTHAIYSITRHVTSSSIVEFQHTPKKVYVSRHYYKSLKDKLSEKRR